MLTTSAALCPACDMRMSSGPSRMPSNEFGGKPLPAGNCCGVAVQSHHPAIGCFQNGPRIAPRPKGSVDVNGAGFRPKRPHHLVKHDGHMARRSLAYFRGHFGQNITVNKTLTFARHCPREH